MWKIALWCYFVAFVVFSSYVLSVDGLFSAFPPFENLHTLQIFFDLGASIGLVSIWVYFDMKNRGRPVSHFGIYLLGVAATGSISPMLYLLVFRGGSVAALNSLSNGQPADD
jgi:hypothetical protein